MSKCISLSINYLLRKQLNGKYILYNKKENLLYEISQKLFNFLYLYKYRNIDLSSMFWYLSNQGIEVKDIKCFCQKEKFRDLFTETDGTIKIQNNIYNNHRIISPYTEYTPERIDFLITKHCNLKCKHCFEDSSPTIETKRISLDALYNTFQQMDDLNIKTLKITGGEPLSYPNIYEILKKVSRMRFECIILTNGLLLTQELIDIISKGNIKLGISLDGSNELSHEYLRGKGTYKILINKLNCLKQAGIQFSITTSVNKINYTEIEDIAKYVIEDLGAQRLFINQLKPLGRAKNNRNIFLSDSEYKMVISQTNSLINIYGTEKITISDDVLMEYDYSKDKNITKDLEDPIVCAAGNSSFSIDNQLYVYPCIYGNDLPIYEIGDLKKQSIIDIWLSSRWDPFRGKTQLKDILGCRECSYSNVCSIKNCRMKPVYNGQSFYSHIMYCKH
jgi:radical SAM protein with 4Fe4S-binding SPASM domain